jgi:hypothetical protein
VKNKTSPTGQPRGKTMLVGSNSSASRDPQQLISQNVHHLIEQLQNGKSEALISYLCAMARFHKYSFGNVLLIATQRSDATRVAGFHT